MSATATERDGFDTSMSIGNLIVIAGLTAVLFAGGLYLSELALGELGLDIDWKPFFIVYAIIAFVPWGTPTLAAALGGGLAEGLIDVLEGAAADDPFGWVGYVVGFTAAGYIIGDDTDSSVKLASGAVVGALLQYAIEGLYLFVLGGDHGGTLFGAAFSGAAAVYAVAVVGNTITHGVILGAIPLIPTVDYIENRADRLFPNAAEEAPERSAD